MIRRLLDRLALWLEMRKPGPDPDDAPDLTDEERRAFLDAIRREEMP